MNDALKFLSRMIRPLGYHIRPYAGMNFLRIPALEKLDLDPSHTATRKSFDQVVPVPPRGNLNSLHIYLRTCLRTDRNINAKTRPGGADNENAYGCIWSLVQAINHAKEQRPSLDITLTVMDDRSSPEYLDAIKAIVAQAKIQTHVLTTSVAGQGASLHETFSKGREDDALVYFVEDDYLHEEDAILCLCDFYKQMALTCGSHLVLYPQEHMALYSNHYPSYIVKGADRHWRTISHATHTLFTHGHAVKQFWQHFENTKFIGNRKKRRLGSEAKTTDKLFRKIPGFSPLKACAVHFQSEGLLPPFFDWKPLWEKTLKTFEGIKPCIFIFACSIC